MTRELSRITRIILAVIAMLAASVTVFVLFSYTLLPIDIHNAVLLIVSVILAVIAGVAAAAFVLRHLSRTASRSSE